MGSFLFFAPILFFAAGLAIGFLAVSLDEHRARTAGRSIASYLGRHA